MYEWVSSLLGSQLPSTRAAIEMNRHNPSRAVDLLRAAALPWVERGQFVQRLVKDDQVDFPLLGRAADRLTSVLLVLRGTATGKLLP